MTATSGDALWVTLTIGALQVTSFICDVVFFPFYMIIQKPWRKLTLARRLRAIPVSRDDNQITYRTIDPPTELHVKVLSKKLDTFEKMFSYATTEFANRRCLGTRKIIREVEELQPNGRIFKKYELGDYQWITFAEAGVIADSFGRGLRQLGLQPKQHIVIFAETRAEWMLAAHGMFKYNFVVCTVYATLGDSGIIHSINETEVDTVITSHELVPKLKALLSNTPRVKRIIFMEDQLHKTDTTGFKEDIELFPFTEVVALGSRSRILQVHPESHDIAIIMYTSGSTGTPKGVLITHENCMESMKNFLDIFQFKDNDVAMGLLPLAHVFELLMENMCLINGTPIGYSTPLTFTDTSSKIMRGCKGDTTVLVPTLIVLVPLIFDRVRKGIYDKIQTETQFKRAFFSFAYNYKSKWAARGGTTPLMDKLVFKKIAKMIGGKVRCILSGGAPLSPDTHEMIKLCLCTELIQGYGLTETACGACAMDKHEMRYGTVGPPSSCNDIRLVNWEEGNYKVTNKPNPQGEIMIGGGIVSKGYYKQPEKTAEEYFEQDGKRWFRTGDIGEYLPDGVLRIIDRKKDLVKLQAGEYVSLGKVESELKLCSIVENICVYGDSTKHNVVALIVPSSNHLEELAIQNGITGKSYEELCENEQMEKIVLKQLEEHGKKCRLQKTELPAAIRLCKDVWTPDSGLVTAAFKLRRKVIQETYQNDIDKMYRRL